MRGTRVVVATTIEMHPMVIGGERRVSRDGAVLTDVDPATGRVFAQVPAGKAAEVAEAVAAARLALRGRPWATLAPSQRGRILTRLAELLLRDTEAIATVESRDTGKPISQARADVAGAARYFEYYGGMADKLNGESIPLGEGTVDYTVREPIGVSAHIVPWNFPLQMTSRGVAPALAAGCTVIVKPSSEAPLSPLMLAALAAEAGLPAGVLNVITGRGDEAGVALASHPQIDQLTFTGSFEAGTMVAALAAHNVVPTVLELGGKSPNVVFPDADVDLVVPGVLRAIFLNAGQSCTAGSRLLVHRAIHNELVGRLVEETGKMTLGPGFEDPDIGPVISLRQLERIAGFIRRARTEGAHAVVGGERASGSNLAEGYFFQPTVLDEVTNTMEVAREEVFGPVLAVIPFDTESEALELANDTRYGLVAGVWTRDIDRAMRFANGLASGQVFVNTWGAGPAESPFGGYKQSGFGREKGFEGVRSYLNIKNICVRFSPAIAPLP